MPFSLEFENIFYNGKNFYNVIYYGTASSITYKDEL
jgi:hypothetical protein